MKASKMLIFIGLLITITMLFAPWLGSLEKSYVLNNRQQYDLVPQAIGMKTDYGVPILIPSLVILLTLIFKNMGGKILRINVIRFFGILFMIIINIVAIFVFESMHLQLYPLFFLEPVGLLLILIGSIKDRKNYS